VQRFDVVALDITLSALAVLLGEVEHAHLAGERTAVGQHTADLLTTQSGIALSVGMEAEEIATLHLAFVLVTHVLRKVWSLARGE
jgi:hypothetical protein